MPWFHHKSEAEKQAEAAQRAEAAAAEDERQASLAALESGGIPLAAERRLEEVRAADGRFFTSDLSVNEFLLTRHAGFRPISQVMGSSIYRMGWKFIGWNTPTGEIGTVSQALNEARRLALGRLEQEAEKVGAHAVVGVRIQRRDYEWSGRMMEFSAIGTAVRLDGAPAGRPAISNLSGQEFWKLYSAGYWPVGVAAGSCAFLVVPSWRTQTMSSWWGSGRQNQELTEFTRGLYAARHLALQYVHSDASRVGADGVVGMTIDQEAEDYEVSGGNDQERTDMIFTFHALGTAIVSRGPSSEGLHLSTAVDISV